MKTSKPTPCPSSATKARFKIVRAGKQRSKDKGAAWEGTLPAVHPKAAGIDVAAGNDLWAAIAPQTGRPAAETVRPFAPTTRGITQMAKWLGSEGVKTVAMEATGIYWLPLYTLLCEYGLEVVVVNPRNVKALRKKTDIADAQWLQYLRSVGLLKNSFVPPNEVLANAKLAPSTSNSLHSSKPHKIPPNVNSSLGITCRDGLDSLRLESILLPGSHPKGLRLFVQRAAKKTKTCKKYLTGWKLFDLLFLS